MQLHGDIISLSIGNQWRVKIVIPPNAPFNLMLYIFFTQLYKTANIPLSLFWETNISKRFLGAHFRLFCRKWFFHRSSFTFAEQDVMDEAKNILCIFHCPKDMLPKGYSVYYQQKIFISVNVGNMHLYQYAITTTPKYSASFLFNKWINEYYLWYVQIQQLT